MRDKCCEPTHPPRDPDGKFFKFCELTQLPFPPHEPPAHPQMRYTNDFLVKLAGMKRLRICVPVRYSPSFPLPTHSILRLL